MILSLQKWLRRKLTRNTAIDHEKALISFIIRTAENSVFKEDLAIQLDNFKNKTEEQQQKDFPGFYLFIERYLFNAVEGNQKVFRQVVFEQFRYAIEQNPDLHLIFLAPDKQKIELFRKFLFSVANRAQRLYRTSYNPANELLRWLDGNSLIPSFLSDKSRAEQSNWVHIAHDFFFELERSTSSEEALRHFNEAYERQVIRYQNLETFSELLKLFPTKALDQSKFNLLSMQQMKELLAEKVQSLETMTRDLHEKNDLLEQSYDELFAQSEQLNMQNEKITEAYSLIEMMNEELKNYNRNLEGKVAERTKELANANKMLTHYNESLEQYTFAISHQLKAPIARLLGLTNLLKLVPPHEQPVIASSVHTAAKELENVFKELVQSLNLKKDIAEVKTEKLHLQGLMESILTERMNKLEISEPDIEWETESGLHLHTDRRFLSEALGHVIDNSLKFSTPGKKTTLKVKAQSDQEKVYITLRDHGLGFDSQEVKNKLFNPFQRFNTTHHGRGMGLYFTKQMITILGGDIQLESKPTEGTQVTITMPLKHRH